MKEKKIKYEKLVNILKSQSRVRQGMPVITVFGSEYGKSLRLSLPTQKETTLGNVRLSEIFVVNTTSLAIKEYDAGKHAERKFWHAVCIK